jgi:hypothetical protein
MTFSINDAEHDTQHLGLLLISVTMLNAVMPSVITPSVVAPKLNMMFKMDGWMSKGCDFGAMQS